MRRPEHRDKHGEITPTPFSFPYLNTVFTPNWGVRHQMISIVMKKNEENEEHQLREQDVQTVIEMMPKQFDSHNFILQFIKESPEGYGRLLIKHKNVKTAHAEISNYLRNHASSLHIRENGKIESEDLFRIIQPCAQWERTK